MEAYRSGRNEPHSKSVRIFGRQISKGQGVKALFKSGRVPGERISSPHIFPNVFQRFTISYLEQYSSGRRGVTRNLVEPQGCQGSNPCCSAKPRGQVNFDSSVPSFLPAHRTRFVPCAEGLLCQETSPRLRLAAIACAEESLEL